MKTTVKITKIEPMASDYVHFHYDGDINEAKSIIDDYFEGEDYGYSYEDEDGDSCIVIKGNIDTSNLQIGLM